MDSRLWSESLPEPQASGKFVLSARKHFGCLKTQLAVNLRNANVVCSNLDQTSSFDIFIKRLRGEPNNLPGFQTFD